MEQAFAEFPLALFTTLAPVGAGGFIILAIAFFTTTFTPEQFKKIDRFAFIPLVVMAIGLIASFAHLATPTNALHVFYGVGTSPLSNEILAASLFGVITLVYCIVAVTGKMTVGARKGFILIVAIAALVFTLFTGLAYSINTVPTWDTPLTPVEIIGYALFGGALLGSFTIALGDGFEETRKTNFKNVTIAVMVLGLIMSLIGVIGRYVLASGLSNALLDGATLTGGLTLYLGAFVILLIIALIMGIMGMRKLGSKGLLCVSTIIALIGILIGRLMFYELLISVGIQPLG